jgi:phytoene/squalene synthetase
MGAQCGSCERVSETDERVDERGARQEGLGEEVLGIGRNVRRDLRRGRLAGPDLRALKGRSGN